MYNLNLFKNSLKLFIFVCFVHCHDGHDHHVAKLFSENKVVPNVIAVPPKQGLKVSDISCSAHCVPIRFNCSFFLNGRTSGDIQ